MSRRKRREQKQEKPIGRRRQRGIRDSVKGYLEQYRGRKIIRNRPHQGNYKTETTERTQP